MAREVPFVKGTIVEDEFLNHTQEALTGLATGLRLAPFSSSQLTLKPSIAVDGAGGLRGQLVATNGGDYRIAWTATDVTSAAYAGGAATVGIYAHTTDPMLTAADGSFELVVSATAPAEFSRKLGEATASSSNALSNVRLTNGVYADAEQWNNFTLRTVLNSSSEIPLTLRGQSAQNTAAAKMLSVGFETATVYGEKWSLSSTGRIVTTQAAAADEHYRAFVNGDTQPSLAISARTINLGPGGAVAPNASIAWGATGVVKVTDTLDVIAIRNSSSTGTAGVAGGQAGMVNVNDDLNLATGSTYRIGGVAISSSNLSDSSALVYLNAANALTGANTVSNTLTAIGDNGYFARTVSASSGQVFLDSRVSGATNPMFRSFVNGETQWGAGGASATDIAMYRAGAGLLKVAKTGSATRAAIQVSDAPSAGDDLCNKTYVDAKSAVTVSTSRTVTGSVTLVSTDDTIFVNHTAACTITLFTAVGNAGKTLTIKDISGNAVTNKVTVDADGTEAIDGALTYILDTNREWVVLRSDGANWHVVG